MSNYEEFIASEDYSPALSARTKAIRDVERYIRRVNKLSEETPNPIAFTDLLKVTKKAIDHLDQMQSKCQELIDENCVEYNDDTAYNTDLVAYDNAVSEWLQILSAESARVQGSIPVKNDMTQVILEQLKSQGDRIETQHDLIKAQCDHMETQSNQWKSQNDLIKSSIQASIDMNSRTGPKPPTLPAPSFCPTGDHDDAKEWKDFLDNFNYFSSGIVKKTHKLLHLRQCLKGRATVDIEHLSLSDNNYDVAIKLLDREYADPELARYKILSFVAECNLDTSDRSGKQMLESIK